MHVYTLPALKSTTSAHQQLLTASREELSVLEQAGLHRELLPIEEIAGPLVRIHGRTYVCWCSNDYLGLSTHPRLIDVACEVAKSWGIGSRASRLLSGTTLWHQRLEEALARWFGAEDAIVYPSGYLANLGTLSTLLSREDAVFVDRFSHASLIDAARSTGARFRVFRHNDATHLSELLTRSSRARRRVIVTEGLFSMEGDRAPLTDILEVAQRRQTLLYLDDAHGAFVLGDTGRGSPEAAGISHDHFIYMATLGKALGTQGGFVIGKKEWIRLLHHRARPFIYTTALAVPVVAAALEALHLLEEEPGHRRRLWAQTTFLTQRLWAMGLSVPSPASHIVPVRLGRPQRALAVSRELWDQGIWAPAIRPPTISRGTARLRLSLTALHSEEHIEALVHALHTIDIV